MAEIELKFERCGKKHGFKNLEQVAKKGWVIKRRQHGLGYSPLS